MATVHFDVKPYKRGGDNVGAAQRIQYIQRQGIYDPSHVPAKARVEHLAKEFGEKLRDDLIITDIGNMPEWAHKDAVKYFAAAEVSERANSRTYTEWKFSLPRELSRDQQLAAVHDVFETHFGAVHPYVWAMHEPRAADGGTNPHIHVIWSSRVVDGIERTEEQFFRQYNGKHPEKGGTRKAKENTLNNIKEYRQSYTDIMNLHLERAGVCVRLHPESHRARGLERSPEPHVLPSDSNAAKFQGKTTEGWAAVLKSRAERPAYQEAEQADAWHYWERRKRQLGIQHDTSLTDAQDSIRHTRGKKPQDEKPHDTIVRLTDDLARLDVFQAKVRLTKRLPNEKAVDALVLAGKALDITETTPPVFAGTHEHSAFETSTQQEEYVLAGIEERENPHGSAVRVRVFEREEQYGR